MPILRLIAKIRNVLPFQAAKSTNRRQFSLGEVQELAEREDFCEMLTAAGVPDMPIPEAPPKKWSEGKEFDGSTFGNAAYRKYQKDFFEK